MANWLDQFLREAAYRRLCTKVGCTTCGAREFREGVIRAAGCELGDRPAAWLSRESATAIASALARVDGRDAPIGYVEAVRFLITEAARPLSLEELRTALAGSWAGNLMAAMEQHAAALAESRRERQEYVAGAPERKAEKRRLKHDQHMQRLAAKAERDRVWRTRHSAGDASQ